MSRDMQIGLLLAVGFLALVGGVLYYRIEHPDELEQYLTGGEAQTESKAPGASTPEKDATTLAQNTPTNGLPAAPAPKTPTLDPVFPPANTATNNPVTLTGGQANTANTATPPSPVMSPPANNLPPAPTGPVLAFPGMDSKPATTTAATEPKKPDAATASRSSLPAEPPGNTLPPPPAGGAPALALDLNSTTPTPPPDLKKEEEKKPVDLTVKPEKPSSSGVNIPLAPTVGLAAVPLVAGMAKNDSPKNDPPKPAPENKSLEMPQPPVVTPPAAGTISFDNKPAPSVPVTAAPALANPPPVSNTPALTNNSPQMNIPETIIKPDVPPVKEQVPVNSTPPDVDGMRSTAPRAGLGKPMTESESQLREKRWSDGAGAPAPIIPSSATTDRRTGPAGVPAGTVNERRVVRDTYIPTERAQRGETFSSLSQRLYGDTNYALALAAYNKEEGFVKMDQPEANEWVAKPNREILDQLYPQLIRRLTPGNFTQKAPPENNATEKAVPVANASMATYKVAKGEQLFEVAKKTLGDGYRWSEIYALNKDQLRDSTELRPGMILKLPTDAKK